MEKLIADAITNRRVLVLHYNGHRRIVEPHMLGTTSAGNVALSAYQTAGGSRSGEVPGWKLMRLSEIHQPAEEGNSFSGARPGYNPNTKTMTSILAQL